MVIVCVLCLFLLLLAALGSVLWWRPANTPFFHEGAAFYWGIFLLAVYVTWPTIRPLLGFH
jgi:hypothetical protein